MSDLFLTKNTQSLPNLSQIDVSSEIEAIKIKTVRLSLLNVRPSVRVSIFVHRFVCQMSCACDFAQLEQKCEAFYPPFTSRTIAFTVTA